MREEAIPASFFVWEQARRARDGAQIHFCRLVRCNPGLYWEPTACAAERVAGYGRSEGKCEPAQPSIP